jgi:hypothetical protein
MPETPSSGVRYAYEDPATCAQGARIIRAALARRRAQEATEAVDPTKDTRTAALSPTAHDSAPAAAGQGAVVDPR